jgi:ATP-binding cassette subfamily F protein 3
MSQLILTNVSHFYGSHRVLEDVNFNFSSGQRACLTGANGAGKTTLLRIMAGQIKPSSGRVVYGKRMQVAYLPQSRVDYHGCTLLEEAERVYSDLFAVRDEASRLEETMRSFTEESERTRRVLERYDTLQEILHSRGFYSRQASIERVLQGLGFRMEDLEKPVESFSSGWQMRVALAKILLSGADILLLDEPTNYLDLDARNWLETFLMDYSGGAIVVSHDRFFLDTVSRRVVEIYQGRLSQYHGTFSQYEVNRREELEALSERFERQQEEIQRIESFIRRFQNNASKARLVQSRIKALERMERIETPPLRRRIKVRFPRAPRSGRVVVKLESACKEFGDGPLWGSLDLELLRGDRLVILGPNGAGKSTLLRIMAKSLEPDNGLVRWGKDVRPGCYWADSRWEGDDEASILQSLEAVAPTSLVPKLKSLLAAFLFRGDDLNKSVSVLSGGERSRFSLLRLLMHPQNLLILDEPTNHLDIDSKEVLLEALRAYDGTLVFVSHDRHFVASLATRVLELRGGRPRQYPGDLQYYLLRKERELEALSDSAEVGNRSVRDKPQSEGLLERKRQLSLKSDLRRLQREERDILERLELLEGQRAEVETLMADEESYRDGERMKELTSHLRDIESEEQDLTRRWEQTAESIRALEERHPRARTQREV